MDSKAHVVKCGFEVLPGDVGRGGHELDKRVNGRIPG